jgi:hypothetical protein
METEGSNGGAKPSEEVIELRISFNKSTNQLSLTGCVDHPVLSWGLLKAAELALRARQSVFFAGFAPKVRPAISFPGGRA